MIGGVHSDNNLSNSVPHAHADRATENATSAISTVQVRVTVFGEHEFLRKRWNSLA